MENQKFNALAEPFSELSEGRDAPVSPAEESDSKENVLIAANLKKTFKLSAKQRKIEKTPLREKVAVNGLSFKAKRGEIYGLLGPNGAGKTTTLRMLATLIKPDAGDAVINGYSIVKQPTKCVRRSDFDQRIEARRLFHAQLYLRFFSELQNIPIQVRDEAQSDALFALRDR